MRFYADTSWWLACKCRKDTRVAIAIEVGSEALLSFDNEQIELAEAAGLKALKLSTAS
jgi:hypothetical protein